MPQGPTTVVHPVRLRMLAAAGACVPLDAELRYDADDPFAVEALFDTGEPTPVRWVFGRDLLASGLVERAGEGDVVVGPVRDETGAAAIRLRLSSPDGAAELDVPSAAVRSFLDRTYGVVPVGTESLHLRIDATIGALLER